MSELVDVVLAGGWRLTARATDPARGEEVRLKPTGADTLMPCGVAATPAALEWRTTDGLVRREGALHHDGDSLVLAVAKDAVVMQRRQYTRVSVAVEVEVAGGGGQVVTRTVDLSEGGMLLERAGDLSVDDRIEVAISLPAQAPVTATAVVRRATPFGHRALELVAVDGDGPARLQAFLASLN